MLQIATVCLLRCTSLSASPAVMPAVGAMEIWRAAAAWVLPTMDAHVGSTLAEQHAEAVPAGPWWRHPPLHSGFATGTAFSEGQATFCKEGFRCVSRVGVFGKDHILNDDVPLSSGRDQDMVANQKQAAVYEWNCPSDGKWKADQFQSGEGDGMCSEEGDCLCVSRSSSNFHTVLEGGKESVIGTFDEQKPDGSIRARENLHIIPHYRIRKMKEGMNIDNPHAILSPVTPLPRQQWLEAYASDAGRLQRVLDQLRDWLEQTYQERIEDKSFVCGKTEEGSGFSPAEVLDAQIHIRRFQILSADCEMIRDQVPKLAGSLKKEEFAISGEMNGHQLNCYKAKDSTACQQLNCYRGFDDEALQNHLREFKAKMDQCQPEKDFPDDSTILGHGEGKPVLQTTDTTEQNEASLQTSNPTSRDAQMISSEQHQEPRQQQMGGLAGAAMAVFLSSSGGSSSSSIGTPYKYTQSFRHGGSCLVPGWSATRLPKPKRSSHAARQVGSGAFL